MKKIFDRSKEIASSIADRLGAEFSQGMSLVSDVVNGLPVFVSSEKSISYDIQYDEKHYFVIPYALSDIGFSLHTMRCLPAAVPEVNDLPKRRVFHFPGEQYEASLRLYLLDSAKEIAESKERKNSNALDQLANDIDSLDNKLTYGMLLAGGIAAIFNPLIGAGIAVKAVTPGVATLLNKYGLRPAGEKLTQSNVEKAAKEAEDYVSNQFADSNTLKVVNPILQELELALRTTESEHDPLIDPNLADGSIPELDGERWRELTEKAVWNVYKEVYLDSDKHSDAKLGPEDLRWLSIIFQRFK